MQPYYLKKVPTIENVNNSIANSLVNINKSFQIPEVTQVPSGISLYSLPTVGRYTYTPNTYNNFSYNRFTNPYEISSLSDAFLNKAGRERLTGRTENDFLDYIANTSQALGHYAKESYIDPLLEFNVAELVVNGIGALGEDLDTFANPIKGMAVESGQDAGDILANVAVAVTTGVAALLAAPATAGMSLGAWATSVGAFATLGGTVVTGVRALAQDAEGAALGVERALGLGDEGRYNYNVDSGNFLGNLVVEFSVDPLNFLHFGTEVLRDITFINYGKFNPVTNMYDIKINQTAFEVLNSLADIGAKVDDTFTKTVLWTNPVSATFLGSVQVYDAVHKAVARRATATLPTFLGQPFSTEGMFEAEKTIVKEATNMIEATVTAYPGTLKGAPNFTTPKDLNTLLDAVRDIKAKHLLKSSPGVATVRTKNDLVNLLIGVKSNGALPRSLNSVKNKDEVIRLLNSLSKQAKITPAERKALTAYAEDLITAADMYDLLYSSMRQKARDVASEVIDKIQDKADSLEFMLHLAKSLNLDPVDLDATRKYIVDRINSEGADSKFFKVINDTIEAFEKSSITLFDANKVHLTEKQKAQLPQAADYSELTTKFANTLTEVREEVNAHIKGHNLASEVIEDILRERLTFSKEDVNGILKEQGSKYRLPVKSLTEQASIEMFHPNSRGGVSKKLAHNIERVWANLRDYGTAHSKVGIPEVDTLYDEYLEFAKGVQKLRSVLHTVNKAYLGRQKTTKPSDSLRTMVMKVLKRQNAETVYEVYERIIDLQAKLVVDARRIVNKYGNKTPYGVRSINDALTGSRIQVPEDIKALVLNKELDRATTKNQRLYVLQTNKTTQLMTNYIVLTQNDDVLSYLADTRGGLGYVLSQFLECFPNGVGLPSELLGSFKDVPQMCKDIYEYSLGYIHFRNLMLTQNKKGGSGVSPKLSHILDTLLGFNTKMSAQNLLDSPDDFTKLTKELFPGHVEAVRGYLQAQADNNLPIIHLPDANFIRAVSNFLNNDFKAVVQQMVNSMELRKYIKPNLISKATGRDFYDPSRLIDTQGTPYDMEIGYKALGLANQQFNDFYVTQPGEYMWNFNARNKNIGARRISSYEETKLGGTFNEYIKFISPESAKGEHITFEETLNTYFEQAMDTLGISVDPDSILASETYEQVLKLVDKNFDEIELGPGMIYTQMAMRLLEAETIINNHFVFRAMKDGTISNKMYDKLTMFTLRNGDAVASLVKLIDLISMAKGSRYSSVLGFNDIMHNTGIVLNQFELQDALAFLKYHTAGGTLLIARDILQSPLVFREDVYDALVEKGVVFLADNNTVFINAGILLNDDSVAHTFTKKYDLPSVQGEEFFSDEIQKVLDFEANYTGQPNPFGPNAAVGVRINGEKYLEFLDKKGFITDVDQDTVFEELQRSKTMHYSVLGTFEFIDGEVCKIAHNPLSNLFYRLVATVRGANEKTRYLNLWADPSQKVKTIFRDTETGASGSPETILNIYNQFNSVEEGSMIFAVLDENLKWHKLPIYNIEDVQKALDMDATFMATPVYNAAYKGTSAPELGKIAKTFRKYVQNIYNAGYLTSLGAPARNLIDAIFKNTVITGDIGVVKEMSEALPYLNKFRDILVRVGNTTSNTERIQALQELTPEEKEMYQLVKDFIDYGALGNPIEEVVDLARANEELKSKDDKSLFEFILSLLNFDNPATQLVVKLYTDVESIGRFGAYLYYVRHPELGLSMTQIATRIINTHFDYSVKSSFETVAQVFIPFIVFPLRNYAWTAKNASKAYSMIKTMISTVSDEWIFRQPDPYSEYAYSQMSSGNLTAGNTLIKWNPSFMDALTFIPGWLIDPFESVSAPMKNVAKAIKHGVNTLLGKEEEAPDYDYPWETNLKRVAKIVTQTIPNMVGGDIGDVPNLVPSFFSRNSSNWELQTDAHGRSGWVPKATTMRGYATNRARPVYSTGTGTGAGTGAGTASTKAYASYTGYAANAYSSGGTKYANRYPQKYYHRNAKFRYLPEMYKQYYTSGGYSRMLMRTKNGPMSPETLSYRLNDLKYQFKK